MSLESKAQEIFVVDPSSMAHPMGDSGMELLPLEVSEHPDAGEVEVHENPIEVLEDLRELSPEALGLGGPDPEPVIEVTEEDSKGNKDKSDAEDVDPAKSAKEAKWNWSERGPTGFIAWVKERCDDVPKHSGYDSAGLERAVAYLERLDNEVSKAMRLDLDGELDANQIEKVRAIIDNGIERLHDRLDKVKSSKKKNRKKKAGDYSEGFQKEAQKITGVQGVFVTVPLLISRIARVCIKGTVSAGHDIEDLYERQVKFYKLNDREQAEVMQLLADMGYVVRQDRGFGADEDIDVGSSDNMDWAANKYAQTVVPTDLVDASGTPVKDPGKIKNLQNVLIGKGAQIKSDGVWGKETHQALSDYQKKNNLPVSGSLNKETANNLGLQ